MKLKQTSLQMLNILCSMLYYFALLADRESIVSLHEIFQARLKPLEKYMNIIKKFESSKAHLIRMRNMDQN